MTESRERELDGLLDRSAPAVTKRTAQRDDALAALVAVTRPKRRVRPRLGVAIAGGIALASVGGVAVAAGLGWTAWWADDAVNEISYTVPSGVECTQIIGNLRGDLDAVAAAEEFMARPDLLEGLPIDEALEEVRNDTHTRTLPDGSRVPAGPGTPYWSEDRAYQSAIYNASFNALINEIDSLGLETDRFSMEREQVCAGDIDEWRDPRSVQDGTGE